MEFTQTYHNHYCAGCREPLQHGNLYYRGLSKYTILFMQVFSSIIIVIVVVIVAAIIVTCAIVILI